MPAAHHSIPETQAEALAAQSHCIQDEPKQVTPTQYFARLI